MPLVSGVCRTASAPKLSHGGSRLNASKPEANPKTRSPPIYHHHKKSFEHLYAPSTAAIPHTRFQREEGAPDFRNVVNRLPPLVATSGECVLVARIIQPKAFTQYQPSEFFLPSHRYRRETGPSKSLSFPPVREFEFCEPTKLYRIAIYKKVGLCPALAQSISMITRHTPKCKFKIHSLATRRTYENREARTISE